MNIYVYSSVHTGVTKICSKNGSSGEIVKENNNASLAVTPPTVRAVATVWNEWSVKMDSGSNVCV